MSNGRFTCGSTPSCIPARQISSSGFNLTNSLFLFSLSLLLSTVNALLAMYQSKLIMLLVHGWIISNAGMLTALLRTAAVCPAMD